MYRQGDVLLVAVDGHPGRRRAPAAPRPPGPRRGRGHRPRPRDRRARRPRVPRRRRALRARPLGRPAHPRGARDDRPPARRLPGRHPARVRARAARHAGLAPGGRLMSDFVLPRPPADEAEARQRIDALAERDPRGDVLHRARGPATRGAGDPGPLPRVRPDRAPDHLGDVSSRRSACLRRRLGDATDPAPRPDATGAIGTGNGADVQRPRRIPFPLPIGFVDRTRSRIEARLDDLEMSASLGNRSRLFEAIRAATPRGRRGPRPARRRHRRPRSASRDESSVGQSSATRSIGSSTHRRRPRRPVRLGGRPAKVHRGDRRDGAHHEAVQAMQPGQFDSVTPRIAAIEQVFGAPYWRIASPTRRDPAVDRPRLEIAESAGPWWAARRARDRQRAAAPARGRRPAAPALARTVPRSPTATAGRSTPGTASGSSRGSSRSPSASPSS